MGKAIAVVSGKGGVGKTTFCLNLAFCLTNLGKEVIVVDANITAPNISIYLGSLSFSFTLNNILTNACNIYDAIYVHDSGIKILPASLSLSTAFNAKANFHNITEVISVLKQYYDYILVDCAPGFGDEVIHALNAVDEVIVVCNPELPSFTEALKSIGLVKQLGKPVAGLIVNKYDANSELDIETIQKLSECKLLGVIDFNNAFSIALCNKSLAVQYSKQLFNSFNKIAMKLTNQYRRNVLSRIIDFLNIKS